MPLFLTLLGAFTGGVGKDNDSTESLDGTLMAGTGGNSSSGAGCLLLLLENLSAWPRLPLLLRRFENDFFLDIERGSFGSAANGVAVLGGVGHGDCDRDGGRGGSCTGKLMLACEMVRAVCGLDDGGRSLSSCGSVRDLLGDTGKFRPATTGFSRG